MKKEPKLWCIRDLWKIMRRYVVGIVLCAVLGCVAGVLVAKLLSSAPVYTVTGELTVGSSQSSTEKTAMAKVSSVAAYLRGDSFYSSLHLESDAAVETGYLYKSNIVSVTVSSSSNDISNAVLDQILQQAPEDVMQRFPDTVITVSDRRVESAAFDVKSKPKMGLLGACVGFLVGLCLALLLDVLNPHLQSEEDLKAALQADSVATIHSKGAGQEEVAFAAVLMEKASVFPSISLLLAPHQEACTQLAQALANELQKKAGQAISVIDLDEPDQKAAFLQDLSPFSENRTFSDLDHVPKSVLCAWAESACKTGGALFVCHHATTSSLAAALAQAVQAVAVIGVQNQTKLEDLGQIAHRVRQAADVPLYGLFLQGKD